MKKQAAVLAILVMFSVLAVCVSAETYHLKKSDEVMSVVSGLGGAERRCFHVYSRYHCSDDYRCRHPAETLD